LDPGRGPGIGTEEAATSRGLVRMGLPGCDPAEFVAALERDLGATPVEDDSQFRQIRGELDRYFAGERVEFATPVHILEGTPFQQRVWQELRKIPHGRVASYGEIASRIDKPGACRAVGQANRRNPIAIVIPCHRIVAGDGGLGGFGAGQDLKVRLLGLEGVEVRGGRLIGSRSGGRAG